MSQPAASFIAGLLAPFFISLGIAIGALLWAVVGLKREPIGTGPNVYTVCGTIVGLASITVAIVLLSGRAS